MIIYGYTRVCTESDRNGRESETLLFEDKDQRNRIMFEDYSNTFDTMKAEEEIGETDYNENEKKPKEEFMRELEDINVNSNVYGYIQASDYHVQFEPFSKML